MRGVVFGKTTLLPLFPVSMWPFYAVLWRRHLDDSDSFQRELFHI